MRRRAFAIPALLAVAWLLIGGLTGPYAGKLSEVAQNDSSAFLPESAESTQVAEAQSRFVERPTIPVVVVWEHPSALPPDGVQQAAQQLSGLPQVAGLEPGSPPIPSPDGRALTAVLPVDATSTDALPSVVSTLREQLQPIGAGQVYVTGPGGLVADLVNAFGGIDTILLGVALAVVLVILLLVYRSPLLPILVLTSTVFGLAVASYAVYRLAEADVVRLSGQSQGIMSILVVGAATDYALLLVARYREELAKGDDRLHAMVVAWRRVLGPIVASGSTVIAGLLCLMLSDLRSNSSLGPIAALGIAGAMLVALTFLPALLALLGPAAYWPRRPRHDTAAAQPASGAAVKGLWPRVAALVARRPRTLWVTVTVVLLAAAALIGQFKASGVGQTELFLTQQQSVTGEEALARHFPGGSGAPTVVVASADEVDAVTQVAQSTAGVASARVVTASGAPQGPAKVVDGKALVEVTLKDRPDTKAAMTTVRELRNGLDSVDEAALVGGPTAQQLDTIEIAKRDRTLIVPVVLAVILVVLILLLRSVLAPVLLTLTVVLSFAATLGIAGLVFDHVFGWPGADPSVPLYAFVFLVALGIDYNIFLMTRVREESVRLGTRSGVLAGLVATGGVITSAGVVLAATFSALAVIPLLFLAQIAFLVSFGVLLDTVVVRSLLVPALSYDLGELTWWPSHLWRPSRRRSAKTTRSS
ncbi:MAG TPA: MMPL family transporter [Actinomycetales bacterium]|nr:MMPL family transporter [Actinomycetales bacterium]